MKLGIIGLPQTGKKTIFELLTGTKISPDSGEQKKPVPGFAEIRDTRFAELVRMYEPKKEAPAKIDIQLLPKIEQTSTKENNIFQDIADVDAVCHIVRAFTDDSVYHVKGSVDPLRDIEAVSSDIILNDLIFIEKRLERIEKDLKKKNDATVKAEQELMNRFREHLENELPLRVMKISDEEMKIISSYPFLTMKKLLIALNIDDSGINDQSLINEIKEKYNEQDIDVMQVSAQMESEIESLDTDDEKKEFMDEVGITEPALNVLSRLSMKSLGLMSFFTVGKDEVKQWLVRQGSSAPEAAGAIHSDIQRGFIRAEVIKYDDLTELGSEDAVKKDGRFLTMGKDYTVEDGDIINFRFNV